MHVIVVGCGRLGAELAVALDRDGHSVALIDKNRSAFQRYLPERWSGRAVLGFGFDKEHLEQAGVREAQALAAVTGGDNSNILTARVARETFSIPNVVARIQDPRRAVIYQKLGIHTVASVAWATDQILRRLIPGTTTAEWTDSSGAMSLVERALPAAWAGKKLANLNEDGRFRIVALSRAGVIRMTDTTTVGQEGDVLHVLAATDALEELEARAIAGVDH